MQHQQEESEQEEEQCAVCSGLWCGCQADFWIGFRHDVK